MNTGHQHWTISNGWIPPIGDQTVDFLNVSSKEAHVQIFIYYSTRDPVGPYRLILPAKRMHQVRFNSLTSHEPIPPTTDYACTIDSDVPIVIQHSGTPSQETAEGITAYGK